MKLVILDGSTVCHGDVPWTPLEKLGTVTVYDRTPPELTADRIGDADIVITNKVLITEDILAACPGIRMIAVTATGFNIVDCEAASRRGIPVSNVPDYGTMAVAQFTIGLLLELCHRASYHSETVHQGRWAESADFCYWDFPLTELAGKTLGIFGLGRIGRQTARIAAAIGMRVIACSRSRCPEGEALAEYVTQEELLSQSDVIALHCPLTKQTDKLINENTIQKMKPSVMILNTARGGLIDEAALANALNCGRIGAAAVDVVSSEPISPDNPLLQAKNCIITPHIAWASKECRQRIRDITADNIQAFISGSPIHVVNSL